MCNGYVDRLVVKLEVIQYCSTIMLYFSCGRGPSLCYCQGFIERDQCFAAIESNVSVSYDQDRGKRGGGARYLSPTNQPIVPPMFARTRRPFTQNYCTESREGRGGSVKKSSELECRIFCKIYHCKSLECILSLL